MKVIVSDFDETFYTKKYKKNIKLIKRFVKKGNIFIIATGRNIEDLKRDIEYRNIPIKYYICNDGGTIYNHDFALLSTKTISKSSIIGIIKTLKKSPYITEIKLDSEGMFTDDIKFPINTILARQTDEYEAKHLILNIMKRYKDVKGYVTKNLLIINSIDSDKAIAIKTLSQITNTPKTSIYTIGDSINDIEMNETYTSFAIGNGNTKLNEVSNYLVSDFEEALKIIEKL